MLLNRSEPQLKHKSSSVRNSNYMNNSVSSSFNNSSSCLSCSAS